MRSARSLNAARTAARTSLVLCDTQRRRRCRSTSPPGAWPGARPQSEVRARHPLPQRRRAGRRQFLAGRRGRRRPGPGHDQRLRRALRQRQPHLAHPQPRAQDGLPVRHREPAEDSSREVSRFVDELANLQHDEAPALRRRQRVRPQGRHPRLRRAAKPRSPTSTSTRRPGRQPPAHPGLRPFRPRQRPRPRPASSASASTRRPPPRARCSKELKRLEDEGYLYEGAEASFEILLKKRLGKHREVLRPARLPRDRRKAQRERARPSPRRRSWSGWATRSSTPPPSATARFNALDCALRKALEKFYPTIRDVHLLDFKVRVLDRARRHGVAGTRSHRVQRRHGRLGHGRREREHHPGLVRRPGGLHRIQAPARRRAGETGEEVVGGFGFRRDAALRPSLMALP